jgi:RND family efflux transporter MFP subunit
MCLAGCARTAPAVDAPAAPELPKVTVSHPAVREVTDYFEFPGQTAAVGEVEVRAQVSGYLMKINFEDGQEVKKGDVLFEIDPRPYDAALKKAKGDRKRLGALWDKADSDLKRASRLRPSGAISKEEYEQRESQLKVHEASIESAEAAVHEAELNLEFTRVASPIDGRVSRRLVTEGNLVQAGPSTSTVLTTVVTIDPIYVYFSVDETALLEYLGNDWRSSQGAVMSHIQALKIPVQMGLANEDGFPHTGTLDFVDNKLDRGTGTIRARGVFENAHRELIPGMYVRVRLPLGKPHPALLVPERAIGRDQKLKFLLTVNKSNVVEKRMVDVGVLRGDLRVVKSGLKEDDWVIVKGLQYARPSEPVEPEVASAADSPPSVGKPEHASVRRVTE